MTLMPPTLLMQVLAPGRTPTPEPPSPCSGLIDPSCIHRGGASDSSPPMLPGVGHMRDEALQGISASIEDGVSWLVSNTVSWWVRPPSPDLAKETAVGALHGWMLPICVAVAMVAMLISAAKMMVTRKAHPLVDVGGGLVTIAATTAIGVTLPSLQLSWGDAWCNWVLPLSADRDFGKRMLQVLAFGGVIPSAAVAIILGVVAIMVTGIQAILLMFRQAALIILAGLLPLAAVGTLTTATRPWFKRVTGWMLALIFYKPAAAAVYAVTFILIRDGKDFRVVLMGLSMMVISLIAFPVLLKFFTWTTGGSDSAGGGSFLGAVIGGATAVGALRGYAGGGGSSGSGGTNASEHAGYLNAQLGPQDPAPTADGPDGGTPSGDRQRTDGQPTGSGPAGGATNAANPSGGHHDSGGGPPGAEPVGPATVRAAHREGRRGRDMARWLNEHSGSGDDDGPTGASGAGSGGGGGGGA
ncbi:MAG TPA: hypothetical protein VGF32_09450 [Streptosporangiaceae bacterium]|jgi:hypothetical protein